MFDHSDLSNATLAGAVDLSYSNDTVLSIQQYNLYLAPFDLSLSDAGPDERNPDIASPTLDLISPELMPRA
ncbi:MAG TPA: hypothetical protein PK765_02075 [bacterium]|nr:hypothetical protein [bacterium]